MGTVHNHLSVDCFGGQGAAGATSGSQFLFPKDSGNECIRRTWKTTPSGTGTVFETLAYALGSPGQRMGDYVTFGTIGKVTT